MPTLNLVRVGDENVAFIHFQIQDTGQQDRCPRYVVLPALGAHIVGPLGRRCRLKAVNDEGGSRKDTRTYKAPLFGLDLV